MPPYRAGREFFHRPTYSPGVYPLRSRQQAHERLPAGNMSQKVWAGKLDFPAQEPSCSALENELQAELYDTEGVVHRVGDDAESRAGRSAVWRPELGVIEEIEDLGAELDVQPLHDRSALEHREVKIDYALLPKRRVSAGFVAE